MCQNFRNVLLGGVVTFGLAAGASIASAQTTTNFEGFRSSDPIGSAAGEVMRLLRSQCNLTKEKIIVGVGSETIEKQILTRDQGNNVMSLVHAAFSRTENVSMIPFRDVGALKELESVGMAQNTEELVRRADVIVTASGQRVGRMIRLQLTGTVKGRLECIVATNPVELPAQLVGEVFLSPEVIFGNVARDMWSRSRGITHVHVKAATAPGVALDPQMPGYFSRQMSVAVASTKSDNDNIRETELIVTSEHESQSSADSRWLTEVTLDQMANGYKIVIEAKRKNATSIATEGLVSAADLPTLRRSDLIRQASMIRPQAPRPQQGGQSAAQRVNRTAGDAAVLSISSAPTRIQDSVDDQMGEQRYAFQLFRESFVEFDVVKLGGKQISFKPELFGSNGMPVESLAPGRARINLRRFRLPAGRYELRVGPEERGKHEFILASRAVSTSSMLEFEPAGRLTRKFQDWYAGERQIDRTRTCYAYTQAVEVSPTGWREQRPYIWIVINGDPKVQEIGHFIDDASRYDAREGIKSQFEDQNGTMRPLNVKVIGKPETGITIQPAITNAKGETILDRESVRGYTQGASILLEGRTSDGMPAKVRYSLVGYRSAINAAALNCGRPDLAQDLVWKR
jgi:hypothetical protein